MQCRHSTCKTTPVALTVIITTFYVMIHSLSLLGKIGIFCGWGDGLVGKVFTL